MIFFEISPARPTRPAPSTIIIDYLLSIPFPIFDTDDFPFLT